MTDANDAATQLQSAQDMINALSNQRNAAQNECVQLAVQLNAEKRLNAEKDKKIASLEAQVEKLSMSKPNGHHNVEDAVIVE